LFFISLSSYFVKLHKHNFKLISQSLLDILSSEFFLKLSTLFHEDKFIKSFSGILSNYTLIGTSSKKDTFFHLISSLKHLNFESINIIINLLSKPECQNPSFLNSQNFRNETILIKFAQSPHFQIIHKLLDFKVDVFYRDFKGNTALHHLFLLNSFGDNI
jgi:ankyrin repeat protein